VPVPGYNHSPDCTCGWCFKIASPTTAAPVRRIVYHRRQFSTSASFVNPNATCPVCGEQVFYYESPFGGRVFFDELGPPWPKHGCTSSTPEARLGTTIQPRLSQTEPQWQGTGWEPLRIIRRYKEDDWWVVRATTLGETERWLRLLFDAEPPLQPNMVALFRGWDASGYGLVSYVNNEGEPDEVRTYSYADYVLEASYAAALVREERERPL